MNTARRLLLVGSLLCAAFLYAAQSGNVLADGNYNTITHVSMASGSTRPILQAL